MAGFFLRPQFSKLYHGAKRADHTPHIFATADAAYQGMVTFSKDQVGRGGRAAYQVTFSKDQVGRGERERDRKSTRLNSSH